MCSREAIASQASYLADHHDELGPPASSPIEATLCPAVCYRAANSLDRLAGRSFFNLLRCACNLHGISQLSSTKLLL